MFDNLSAGEIKRKECFMYEGKNGTARELVVKMHEVYGGEAWFPSDGRAEDCILATCTGANINLEQRLAIFTLRPVVSVRWHRADATLAAASEVKLPERSPLWDLQPRGGTEDVRKKPAEERGPALPGLLRG